jgi:hypothetical protein
MRILNTLLILSFIISSWSSLAQDTSHAFFIEINDNKYIPKLDKSTNRFYVGSKLKNANSINTHFSTLDIDNSLYVNDISPNETQNRIMISVLQSDYNVIISTLNTLINTYSYFVSYEEIEVYESLVTPYIPVDYENAVSFLVTDPSQNDLNMIRATEAWGITKGDPNVLIGIADTGFWADHPDLKGELIGGVGNYDLGPNSATNPSGSKHGSAVAGYASAGTDNQVGTVSSIGFDTKLLGASGLSTFNLKLLSDIGAKVVNASFGSPSGSVANSVNTSIEDAVGNGTVVVAAAGNGPRSGGTSNTNGVFSNEAFSSRYYLPASYKDVISVSTVGNKNDIGSTSTAYDNWKDVHLIATSTAYPNGANYSGGSVPITDTEISWQHNDSVDIVVPAYFGSPRVFPNNNMAPNPVDFFRLPGVGGTSYSAPIVAGTVGLMFSVNFCLDPKEIETILKLTAVRIDHIPENSSFYGRLGAGRLDAYEAVKMSKDMADTFGTVEVKDRILYRPWFYKLVTAPYEIKMTNNDVSGGSKLKFRARNNIEILSGEYSPQTGGYIDLAIDGNLVLNNCPPPVSISQKMGNISSNATIAKELYVIYPTLVDDHVIVSKKDKSNNDLFNVNVFNFYGERVFNFENIEKESISLKLNKLESGLYIIKILDNEGQTLHTQKIIKK